PSLALIQTEQRHQVSRSISMFRKEASNRFRCVICPEYNTALHRRNTVLHLHPLTCFLVAFGKIRKLNTCTTQSLFTSIHCRFNINSIGLVWLNEFKCILAVFLILLNAVWKTHSVELVLIRALLLL